MASPMVGLWASTFAAIFFARALSSTSLGRASLAKFAASRRYERQQTRLLACRHSRRVGVSAAVKCCQQRFPALDTGHKKFNKRLVAPTSREDCLPGAIGRSTTFAT